MRQAIAAGKGTYFCHTIPGGTHTDIDDEGNVVHLPVMGTMVDINTVRFNSRGEIIGGGRGLDPLLCYGDMFDIGFFGGEWLLARQRADVMVVQTEPAAVFGALAYPQYVWVAVGYRKSLRAEHHILLDRRTFFLVPSADEVEQGWMDIADVWGAEHIDKFLYVSGNEMLHQLRVLAMEIDEE